MRRAGVTREGYNRWHRQYNLGKGASRARTLAEVLARQDYICPLCQNGFSEGRPVELHHPTGEALTAKNAVALHRDCHRRLHTLGRLCHALRDGGYRRKAMHRRVYCLHRRTLPRMLRNYSARCVTRTALKQAREFGLAAVAATRAERSRARQNCRVRRRAARQRGAA